MSDSIKIRVQTAGEVTTVKALITHPMETGARKDEKGEYIPRHFINEIKAELNGKPVMSGYWGVGVSKNPYVSFRFKGGKTGDTVKLSWSDNKGASDSIEAQIS